MKKRCTVYLRCTFFSFIPFAQRVTRWRSQDKVAKEMAVVIPLCSTGGHPGG